MSSVGKANIIIDAQNNASAELQKVQKDIKKISEEAKKSSRSVSQWAEDNKATFRGMAVGGAIAFGAIVAGANKAVNAYAQQEKAEARLVQIAKQVTNATDEQIQGYKALARELQKVGVVGDDVVIAGQSQLASFTKNHEVVSTLSGDLADLAVAQYGVNVSQEQAIQTANLMGKALQGQLGALTRTGILVSDDYAKAFEQANTEQERAIVLSNIIKDNYGGLNAAMRDTTEGGIQAMKNARGDLWEVLGEKIAPMLTGLAEKMIPLIEKASDWASENAGLIGILIPLSGAIAGIITVIGTLGLALPVIIKGFAAMKIVFLAMGGPIGLLIGLLGGLALYIYKNFDEIKAFWIGVWTSIKDRWSRNSEQIIGVAKTMARVLLGVVTGGMSEVAIAVFKNRDKIQETTSRVWNNVKDTIFEIVGSIVGRVTKQFDKISAVVGKVMSFGKGAISKVGGALGFEARAMGGPVNGGQPYIVGEKGPELFVPGNSGNIIPNNKIGGGQGISLSFGNVIINNGKDEKDFAMMVENTITKAIRGQSLGYI